MLCFVLIDNCNQISHQICDLFIETAICKCLDGNNSVNILPIKPKSISNVNKDIYRVELMYWIMMNRSRNW